MTGVYITLGIAALVAVCVFVIWIQAKRIKKYSVQIENLRLANREAASRLEHIREYISKNKITMEAANAERETLNETPDAGLADRANSLFGGVRGPAGGGTGAS